MLGMFSRCHSKGGGERRGRIFFFNKDSEDKISGIFFVGPTKSERIHMEPMPST